MDQQQRYHYVPRNHLSDHALIMSGGETQSAPIVSVEHFASVIASQRQHDFVSKRHQALPHDHKSSINENDRLWNGASEGERLLVSCCTRLSETTAASSFVCTAFSGSGVKNETREILGSLDPQHILRFLQILALYCHDVESRILALSILERSRMQDESEIGSEAGQDPHGNFEKSDTKMKSSDCTGLATVNGLVMSESCTVKIKNRSEHGRRVPNFLAAGGMKILHQWLIDASSLLIPLSSSKPTASSSLVSSIQNDSTSLSSPSGHFLIFLLNFLSSIPFDKQLVTESKINKHIQRLSREVETLLSVSATNVGSNRQTLEDASASIDVLKQTWEDKAKLKSEQTDSFILFRNQLEPIQNEVSDQHRMFEHYKMCFDVSKKPHWLCTLEGVQKKLKKKDLIDKHHSKLSSTVDLARQERENERAVMMREDLQKAQEQRRLMVLKLRDLRKKNLEVESLQKNRVSGSKKRIHWKDGVGAASQERKRDLLEQVFFIPNKKQSYERFLYDMNTDDKEKQHEINVDLDSDTYDIIEVL